MATRPQTATWNREDRDLLVELRTNMAQMAKQLLSMDITMKEINAGYSSRLLALESNVVNRLQFGQLEARVDVLETSKVEYRATIKAWLIIGGAVWTVTTIVFSVWLAAKF